MILITAETHNNKVGMVIITMPSYNMRIDDGISFKRIP
jgi:hypothetical protein